MISSSPVHRALLLLLMTAYVLWGALYIARTSITVDGVQYFTLWDDGMISMRYAENLVSGAGLRWNPEGDPVQGITNPGVCLVMAALQLLPPEPARAALAFQIFNLALLAGILWLVVRIGPLLFEGDVRVGLAAGLASVLYAPLAIWSLQGSDVAIIAALTLLALWRVLDHLERTGEWPLDVFAILAVGVVMRLDTSVVYAVFVAGSLLLGRRRLATAALGGALLVAMWAALMGFGALYYGDPLPNTYYLKATGSPRRYMFESAFRQFVFLATTALTPLWLLVGVPTLIAFKAADRRIWLAAGLVAAVVGYHFWTGGDWVYGRTSRFVVPVMPVVILLCVGSARTLIAHRLPRVLSTRAGAMLMAAVGILASLVVHPPEAQREWLDPSSATMFKRENRENIRYGIWLGQATRPETSVALHWAGTVAFLARRPAIDVLGRSDRHIARLQVDRFAPGHSKWDWDYVLEERRPDVIVRTSRGLAAHPAFLRDYVRAEVEGVGSLYVRKTSLDRLIDPGGLELFNVGLDRSRWTPAGR